jgi:tryptophan synthase alpha subunit
MTLRLQQALSMLKPKEHIGVIPYITVGFPTVDDTLSVVPALEKAGATVVELGIPFSDPLADGPTIQAASLHALQQGVTTDTCLEVCQTLRKRGLTIPILFMGYYNPILSYGIARFAKDAAEAGADGMIVPDLPPEEAGPLRAELSGHELSFITMLAPTSTDERIALVCRNAEAFIYCVSVAGVTGARTEVPADLFGFLARVRQHTTLPLAVGFGISERRHVETIGAYAEAVIVGSKLVSVVDSAPRAGRASHAARLIAELTGMVAGPTAEDK